MTAPTQPIVNHHTPVLLDEVANFLNFPQTSGEVVIFDGTFGGGGYSQKFLELGWQVFACDLDTQAIENFYKRSPELATNSKLKIENSNFADYLKSFSDDFFQAMVLDLGFSSNQLASSQRGFSFKNTDEILDLRFDDSGGQLAWEKLRSLSEPFEIQKIFYTYSGEPLSARLARATFELLQKTEGSLTVGQLTEVLTEAIPAKFKPQTNSILSRVWQALRIWTNDELQSLQKFLALAPSKLRPRGRLAIVSFHSLEDKLATKTFRQLSRPQPVDDFGNTKKNFDLLTPKGIKPAEEEIRTNPRSRSAVLRVLEKLPN